MAAIYTREVAGAGATVVGAPLSNAQIDNNFININVDLIDVIATRYTKVETETKAIEYALTLG